jgi:riboflavin synthase
MFTGLVEKLGTVRELVPEGSGTRLLIDAGELAAETVLGESVAINGACLTVVSRDATSFAFQAGPETLARTNLGQLMPGDRVNLERSMQVGDRLGGHIVQGHVDAVGAVDSRQPDGEWLTMWFRCPSSLTAEMVSKGSIAVDGVSLTLVDVTAERFSVALIPHTLSMTTLGFKQPGEAVNLETDVLGKYVVKYLRNLSLAGNTSS